MPLSSIILTIMILISLPGLYWVLYRMFGIHRLDREIKELEDKINHWKHK